MSDLDDPGLDAALDQVLQQPRPAQPIPNLERPQRTFADPRRTMADTSAAQRRAAIIREERAREAEANPFLTEQAGLLPELPDDDPNFAYLWARVTLPGEGDDRSNIAEKTTGLLRYEYVRWEDMPPNYQRVCEPYRLLEGRHAGFMAYRDVVLMRCDRRMRDLKVEADLIRAARQRDLPRQEAAEHLKRMGGRAAAFQDEQYYER